MRNINARLATKLAFLTAPIADRKAAKDNGDEGATMVEYGLMVALIAVVVAVGAATLGTNIKALFEGLPV